MKWDEAVEVATGAEGGVAVEADVGQAEWAGQPLRDRVAIVSALAAESASHTW